MKKIAAFINLMRPLNCIITSLSVWIAAVVAGDIVISYRIIFASISAFLINSYGNIINDIFDIEVDRLSKSFRPLAQGIIGKREAAVCATVSGVLGLAMSYNINANAPIIAFLSISLLLIYTPFLKGIPFVGNLAVATIASLVFIYGGMAVDRPFGALILSAFAFLMHLGREIVKDIEDRKPDSQIGHRTAATFGDAGIARNAAIVVFAILIAGTTMPLAIGFYGIGYFLLALAGVDLVLIESIHKLARTCNPSEMHRVAQWLKIAMPFGLLAVLVGHLGW